jgi:aspartate-semialdehyde dehydrogenase
MQPNKKLPVAILGATGAVGQRCVRMLEYHPWFEVAIVTGSERSIGRPYGEVTRWVLDGSPPAAIASMIVQPTDNAGGVPLAISALPADQAREAEPAWARAGTVVCSNASAYRMDPLVPLLIPEVNPEHIALIETQRNARGWSGAIVTNPNCATITLVMALMPLYERYGLSEVFATTLQAISGAGYPGVASLDILDNVVPFIGGEEEKIESEPLKLLGTFADDHIKHATIAISAGTSRRLRFGFKEQRRSKK